MFGRFALVLVAQTVLTRCTHLALVSYDWLINLDREIRYFWDYREGRKPTAASLLYGLSRYPTVIGQILQLPTAFPLSDMVTTSPHCIASYLRPSLGVCVRLSYRSNNRPLNIPCSPMYTCSCQGVSYLQTAINIPYALAPAGMYLSMVPQGPQFAHL